MAAALGEVDGLHPLRVAQIRVGVGGEQGSHDGVVARSGGGHERGIPRIVARVDQLHPLIGERLCLPLRCAEDVIPVIRHHQERWDGRGYPDGLSGEQIPLLARILAIADAFDALTSDRPYRPAMTRSDAAVVLRDGAGQQWDPELVELFLTAMQS